MEVVWTAGVAESAGVMTAAENAEMMTVDVDVKEPDAAVTQAAVVETIGTMMDVTAGQIPARNPDLNKDHFCSIRIQAADVKNPRIMAATVNSYRK